MINGLTVNEYNARERLRASIVARLHGNPPFDEEEGLKAQFLELTGEPYRTREEEVADQLAEQLAKRAEESRARATTEQQIIDAAVANGFMQCRAIRDALGWDKPGPNGNYYSSMSVAFHWIEEADEEVVYLIPDGITDVTKSERTGCYPDVFARVLAAKEQWDADRTAREKKSWDDAQAAKDAFHKQKEDELAELIAQQEAARAQRSSEQAERYAQIDAASDAEIQMLIAEAEDDAESEQVIPAARRQDIGIALRSYAGPLTKNGLPKRKHLNDHAGFKIAGWEKRECWPEVQGG